MVYKTPQLVFFCNLINAIKALCVLNCHLKFIPEFVKGFVGWQVQAIEAGVCSWQLIRGAPLFHCEGLWSIRAIEFSKPIHRHTGCASDKLK